MVTRTELETTVREMVAYDILSKPLSSLGQKAGRRRDKLAQESAGLLRQGDEFERVIAYVEHRDEEKARTMRDGIESFKDAYPRYGKILEGMIQDKRVESNRYLVYGVAKGCTLGVGEYRNVMKDIGLNPLEADAMYPHLLQISERLGKAGEYELRNILL